MGLLQYFEDYDINDDGEITVQDVILWNEQGREDIAMEITQMIVDDIFPPKKPPPPPPPPPRRWEGTEEEFKEAVFHKI